MLNFAEQKIEIKSFDFKKRTFRASATGIGNVDHGLDKFMPGSFARSIAGRIAAGKVKFVDAHFYKYANIPNGSVPSAKYILGKVLSAEETATDLIVEIYVSDTADGNDILTKIKDGTLDALSVGYIPIKVHYEKQADGKIIRVLEEVKLMEVSAVIWGMNDRGTIDATSVKSALEAALESVEITDEAKTSIKAQLEGLYKEQEEEKGEKKPEVKAVTFDATLSEEMAEDDMWKANQTFNKTLRDIMEDEGAADKTPLLDAALNAYKGRLAELLGLAAAEQTSPDLTSEPNLVTILANEPLMALLTEAKAHGQAPVPLDSEGTRFADEDRVDELQTKLRELQIKQLGV